MAGKRPSDKARAKSGELAYVGSVAWTSEVDDAVSIALDEAREEGRREREAEIVAWLRREASILLGEKGTPLSAAWAAAHQQAAEGIENGAVPSTD